MKFILAIIMVLGLSMGTLMAQSYDQRISKIKQELEIRTMDTPGLSEMVESTINTSQITLANFLVAISDVHHININVSKDLAQVNLVKNFTNIIVSDLLLFLCKEYNLTIDFTGNILSVKKYQEPVEQPRVIPVVYNPSSGTISLDLKDDVLYDVFKRIMDETGINLVFSPELGNNRLTVYLKEVPFDTAMNKMAFSNNLFVERTKDNFYVFENNAVALDASNQSLQRPLRIRNANFNFTVLDLEHKLLQVNIVKTPISEVIAAIGEELDIDLFTATPLENAGVVSFKATRITFDDLLTAIFEMQTISDVPINNDNSPNQNVRTNTPKISAIFTFKKEGNIYYFGTENQLSVRKVEIVALEHRSIEMLSDPNGGASRSQSRIGNQGYNNNSSYTNFNSQFDNTGTNVRNRPQLNTNNTGNFNTYDSKMEALVNILPDEIKADLDIKVDYELNSFYVNGPSEKIERFKQFVKEIDKAVPVVLIEVMLIEVNKTSTVETGVSWGIGESPTETKGAIFPQTDITLGAQTINKVIGGFDGFGSFNLGKVVPNFYATIKAMEANGNLKIRSTPKLSTLNGHRATFSNGETSYYAVTQRNIYGTDNPQTSEITNYEPIDAELGITIKPLVSGDGQVTLDIFVIQSSFGQRIENEAPPDISSREFSSIIRVRDQDIVVLGGLEEQVKNDSGSGVPLLSRIPVIKWLFSSRKRTDSKAKLTVLIKPTIIY